MNSTYETPTYVLVSRVFRAQGRENRLYALSKCDKPGCARTARAGETCMACVLALLAERVGPELAVEQMYKAEEAIYEADRKRRK